MKDADVAGVMITRVTFGAKSEVSKREVSGGLKPEADWLHACGILWRNHCERMTENGD